jgi:transcriptional regulator with XRE-family HTH domain
MMTEKKVNISKQVAYLLDLYGPSPSSLAKKLGVTTETVLNWEKGGSPSERNLANIVKITGCTLEWLTTGEGTPPGFLALELGGPTGSRVGFYRPAPAPDYITPVEYLPPTAEDLEAAQAHVDHATMAALECTRILLQALARERNVTIPEKKQAAIIVQVAGHPAIRALKDQIWRLVQIALA